MEFSEPLVRGRLLRRYKRFLADVTLDDGRDVTAHCANPGAMLGLSEPGMTVWLEPTADPRRSLAFAWRLVEVPGGGLVGIDTSLPNRVVGEALREGAVPALAGYSEIRPEVRFGLGSRVDFLARGPGLPDAYVEVKNVHLSRASGRAEFPDSVTARGAKHLRELAAVARSGHRALMLYLVQRTDCGSFGVAADIDPGYATAFDQARAAGVETVAHAARITTDGVWLGTPMPIE